MGVFGSNRGVRTGKGTRSSCRWRRPKSSGESANNSRLRGAAADGLTLVTGLVAAPEGAAWSWSPGEVRLRNLSLLVSAKRLDFNRPQSDRVLSFDTVLTHNCSTPFSGISLRPNLNDKPRRNTEDLVQLRRTCWWSG